MNATETKKDKTQTVRNMINWEIKSKTDAALSHIATLEKCLGYIKEKLENGSNGSLDRIGSLALNVDEAIQQLAGAKKMEETFKYMVEEN